MINYDIFLEINRTSVNVFYKKVKYLRRKK